MRTVKFIYLAILLVFIGNSVASADGNNTYSSFNGVQYVKNYDGDTIIVDNAQPNTYIFLQ